MSYGSVRQREEDIVLTTILTTMLSLVMEVCQVAYTHVPTAAAPDLPFY